MSEFEPEMATLHDARRSKEPGATREKDRLRIAMSERFEHAQPPGENRCDLVKRELGMNTKHTLRFARGEPLFGAESESALEFRKGGRGQRESDGKGVSTEAGEKIGACLDGRKQRKAVDGAARAVCDTVFNTDDDGRLRGPLDDTGCEDADDSAMPPIAVNHKQARRDELSICSELRLNCLKGGGLCVAAFAVQAIELKGEFLSAGTLPGAEEFNDVGSHVHTSGGVDAGRDAKGDVEARDGPRGWINLSSGEELAEADADRAPQLAQAESCDDSILAEQGNSVCYCRDGGHFEKAGEELFAGPGTVAPLEDGLRELEGYGRAAKRLLRVGASMLIGIEDGKRGRSGFIRNATCGCGAIGGFGQVMVCDDEVEPEALCGPGFLEGAHSCIDGNDEADSLSVSGFEHV